MYYLHYVEFIWLKKSLRLGTELIRFNLKGIRSIWVSKDQTLLFIQEEYLDLDDWWGKAWSKFLYVWRYQSGIK